MPRKQKVRRPGALTDLQPGRILTQIALLQIAYYASAAILLVFTALVAGRPVSVGLLFSWRKLRGDTTVGWMFGFVWMLNSLVTSVGYPIAICHVLTSSQCCSYLAPHRPIEACA